MPFPEDDNETGQLGSLTPQEAIARTMPSDVAAWWNSLNIVGDFTIEIERAKGSGGVESLPPVTNRIPSQTEIGEQYGPGRYRIIAVYHPATWKEGKNDKKPGPWFELSEDGYQDLYEAYQSKRAAKRAAKNPQPVTTPTQASSGIAELAPLIQALAGVLKPAPVAPVAAQDNSVLVAMIQSQAAATAQQMQMFMQMSQQTMQMVVQVMGTKNNDGDGLGGAMDKFFGMMEKSMDIRDRLVAPPKEESSTFDRLMDGIGNLLPHLGSLLSMNSTMRNMVVPSVIRQQSPEVQTGVQLLKTDDNFRDRVIAKTREVYGDKADEVLEAIEILQETNI